MDAANAQVLRSYYTMHSRLYDWTRWSFLFGRRRLIRELLLQTEPRTILEVGCGTGTNLARLARAFPRARLVGLDASPAMLAVARRKLSGFAARTELREAYYEQPLGLDPAPEVIVFSYCLSMIDPGCERAIRAASVDLAPGGVVAVLDFHASALEWFRHWMRLNHVRMEGHLLPLLGSEFAGGSSEIRGAYFGLWRYFRFMGRR